MAAPTARCSECAKPLVNADGSPKLAGTKTCTPACRQVRARRIKRQQREAGHARRTGLEHQDMAAAVSGQLKDAAHETLVDELRPVVREAMTAEVLASISTMVGITPRAIELLQQQMESSDETIAQRAVTLLLKYTMGNPSVAPPPAQQAPAPMSVVFQLPRPGDTTIPSSVPADASELRDCTDCGEAKTDAEFVGGSDRCQVCFDKLRGTVEERFA